MEPRRVKQFNDLTGLDFYDLKLITYKPGYHPRDCTDYYYHLTTGCMYGYCFRAFGRWKENVRVDLSHIDSPPELCPHLQNKDSWVEYKLSENYKLELEKDILKLQIKLEKLKSRNS